MPLWLSESDVRAVLAMGELIDAMELALIAFSARRVPRFYIVKFC
jgi:ornithine cyclodeaminase/alanine dehydrogenase-like protein (mu-crystallin family)